MYNVWSSSRINNGNWWENYNFQVGNSHYRVHNSRPQDGSHRCLSSGMVSKHRFCLFWAISIWKAGWVIFGLLLDNLWTENHLMNFLGHTQFQIVRIWVSPWRTFRRLGSNTKYWLQSFAVFSLIKMLIENRLPRRQVDALRVCLLGSRFLKNFLIREKIAKQWTQRLVPNNTQVVFLYLCVLSTRGFRTGISKITALVMKKRSRFWWWLWSPKSVY